MSQVHPIDALRAALEPVESLRGEHAQVAEWVHESFAAVEGLHNELSQWQQELAEQQAVLDERLRTTQEANASETLELQKQLDEARREIDQWASDSADQLALLEELERQQALLTSERDAACQQAVESAAQLETERERAAVERDAWLSELRELRRVLLEKWEESRPMAPAPTHCESNVTTAELSTTELASNSPSLSATLSPAAELRQRAQQRLEARQRRADEG